MIAASPVAAVALVEGTIFFPRGLAIPPGDRPIGGVGVCGQPSPGNEAVAEARVDPLETARTRK